MSVVGHSHPGRRASHFALGYLISRFQVFEV
jgi:hypothetical protein